MATYNTARDISLRRQEGDSSDLTVIVPTLLDMKGATVRFQVKDIAGRLLIDKSTLQSTIFLEGQTIHLQFDPTDTKRRSGIHRWELEVTISGSIYTIARGSFEIVKELIV
jgi:hypothetical protein